jgi:hypothetical protein
MCRVQTHTQSKTNHTPLHGALFDLACRKLAEPNDQDWHNMTQDEGFGNNVSTDSTSMELLVVE